MIRLGFIGVGFVAQQCHLPSFDSALGCQILAVSDLRVELAKKIARRYEISRVYSSHEELLNDREIDAVVITVPRPLTSGLCISALNAGKMVFTEKPIALNLDNANQVLSAAKTAGLPVQVGYMRRYDAATLATCDKVSHLRSSNHRPRIVRAHCYMGDSYCSPFGDFNNTEKMVEPISSVETLPNWLDDATHRGYETYLNVFSHLLDLTAFILDSKLSVERAFLDEAAQGVVVFSAGSETLVEVTTLKSKLNQWTEGISFVYQDRILDLALGPAFLRNVPGVLTIREGDRHDLVQHIRPAWSWSFKNQAEAFIEVCQNWPNSESNLSAAIEQVSLVEDIYRDLGFAAKGKDG